MLGTVCTDFFLSHSDMNKDMGHHFSAVWSSFYFFWTLMPKSLHTYVELQGNIGLLLLCCWTSQYFFSSYLPPGIMVYIGILYVSPSAWTRPILVWPWTSMSLGPETGILSSLFILMSFEIYIWGFSIIMVFNREFV